MNPYEAIFKALMIVSGGAVLGWFLSWIINKSQKK